MSTLAVVLVDYKTTERTVAYVREELAKVKCPMRIVIVDNASSTEARAMLTQELGAVSVDAAEPKADAQARIVVADAGGNLGFARGNNLGAEIARQLWQPDFLLFSNNDIRFVQDDVAEYLIDVLEREPEAGIAGPDIVGLDGRRQSPAPYMPFWDNHLLKGISRLWLSDEARRKRYHLNYAAQAEEGYHYRILGGFFMARAKDFFRCGGFDPKTFLFYEEMILAERLSAIGRGVYWTPQRQVVHEHSATIGRHVRQKQKERIALQSELYYYRAYRHYARLNLLLGKAWIRLSNLKKAFLNK